MAIQLGRSYDGPVIDACVHHHWSSQADIMQYMSQGWREYLGRPGSLPGGAGAIPIRVGAPYRNPEGDKLATAYPPGASAAGSDPALLRRDILDSGQVRRVILCHDAAMFTPALPNAHLAVEVARAVNDWTAERWLEEGDTRLYALVLVPNQLPEAAAAEVRRAGAHARMVGILMGGNGVGKPFGHPIYHPIYEAASDMGLTVVIHGGGDAVPDTLTHPTAGGLPLTFGEYSALAACPLMTHLVSMIAQGVFERFPDLRLFLVGGGTAWIPMLFFRLDVNWRGLRREVPWVRRQPSEYFREQVRVSTYPLDRPAEPERLVRLLNAYRGADQLLIFGSGYPDWNRDLVEEVATRVPESWHKAVFHDNALGWFRWSGQPTRPRPAPTFEVGRMPVTGLADTNPARPEGPELEWVPADD